MEYDPNDPNSYHAAHVEEPRPSFWRKLGGGSLSISILVHAALLAVGVVWVLQVIPLAADPAVDFMPKGGGGGQSGQRVEIQQKKRATMTPANAPRVAAKDVVSNFTLPEPDPASSMSSLGALGGSSLSGGLGGSGSGGGRGDGKGTGFGSGMGPGLGGTGVGANPFGMLNPNANALVGSFYDTKQDEKRKPTDMTPEKLREVLQEFTSRGWRERSLESKYFKAPRTLYQTKLYIPLMSADAAPAAFQCEKEVQPSRWIVVYRGTVTPPKTAKYRFVGAGDDALAVRFNNKHVFDHGFTSATAGKSVAGRQDVLAEKKEDKDWVRSLGREYAMKLPVTYYQYPTTRNWNSQIGGLAVGPEFEATAGQAYPIEILVSEIPGGLFCASLLIEEVGATYQKASTGAPILPLFRLDSSLPPTSSADNAPPFDPQGPVWKLVPGRGKTDI